LAIFFKILKSEKCIKTCKFEEKKLKKNVKREFWAPYSRNFKKIKVGNTLKHANLKKKKFWKGVLLPYSPNFKKKFQKIKSGKYLETCKFEEFFFSKKGSFGPLLPQISNNFKTDFRDRFRKKN
jgi:hypothetical protein